MRRLVLIIMIALLPLRGWAGETMSVAMAAQTLDAITVIADNVVTTRANGQNSPQARADMPVDCPMLAADKADKTSPSPFKACSTCHLCMGLVTGYSMALAGTLAVPQAAQGIASVSFTSAERTASFKPPIF